MSSDWFRSVRTGSQSAGDRLRRSTLFALSKTNCRLFLPVQLNLESSDFQIELFKNSRRIKRPDTFLDLEEARSLHLQLFLSLTDLNRVHDEFAGDVVQGFYAVNCLKRHLGHEVTAETLAFPGAH
jgi:hypothetical protein